MMMTAAPTAMANWAREGPHLGGSGSLDFPAIVEGARTNTRAGEL